MQKMCEYLPDDFLERASDIFKLVSTQNMIIETMQLVLMKIPPGWFPWEGRLSFPHESHSPAPSPCLSTILPRSKNLGKKPFLLKVVRRQKAPVAKRLWLEDAKLIWHSKVCLQLFRTLRDWASYRTTHSTSQDWTAPYRTIRMLN